VIRALLVLAVALPALAADRPAGVVAPLRGPFAYVAGPIPKGLDLTVTLVSARVELYPDFAVVEQTITLRSAGKVAPFWMGVDQPGRWTSLHGPRGGASWTVAPLLGAAAWVDGVAVPEERLQVTDRALDDAGGYSVGLRIELSPGEHVVTVGLAVQTVADSVAGAVRHPAGGTSSLVVALDGLASGFAADEAPFADARVALGAVDSVSLEALTAREWTDGARSAAGRLYWSGPVQLVLDYETAPEAARATTVDSLYRDARTALGRAPRGHVVIPASATPWQRPEDPAHPSTEDAVRARRALLVPAGMLFLLVLVM